MHVEFAFDTLVCWSSSVRTTRFLAEATCSTGCMPCRHYFFSVLQYSEVETGSRVLCSSSILTLHSRTVTSASFTNHYCRKMLLLTSPIVQYCRKYSFRNISAGRMLTAECYCARDKWRTYTICLPRQYPNRRTGVFDFQRGLP
jgi:hypothetical protein